MEHFKNTRFGGNQGFSFRQIKFEMPIRYLRGLVNWLANSGKQYRLQITSCKLSATEMIFKTMRPDEITVLDSKLEYSEKNLPGLSFF